MQGAMDFWMGWAAAFLDEVNTQVDSALFVHLYVCYRLLYNDSMMYTIGMYIYLYIYICIGIYRYIDHIHLYIRQSWKLIYDKLRFLY